MPHKPTELGRRFGAFGLLAFILLGCNERPSPAGPATSASSLVSTPRASPGLSAPDAPACRPARGTKLGQPFVRVCPDATDGPGAAPFFIHAAPVPCAPGDHEELSCPPVIPLQGARTRPGERRILPMLAAVIDASVAHRLCAMRFAGRLPTRPELERARRTLGLATVAVEEGGQPAGSHFAFRRVPEWATAVTCEQPSVLGPECGAAPSPMEAAGRLDWPNLRSCTAVPSHDAALPMLDIGEACPGAAGTSRDPRTPLPCRVRLDAPSATSRTETEAYALSCDATEAEAPRPRAEHAGRIAAIRCVVPESLLDVRPGK